VAFNKFKDKISGYIGSTGEDINDITSGWNEFKDDFGTGKNLSNWFDQRISDGLDDLIHGALGFRTSNIPSISKEIMDAREQSRQIRQTVLTTNEKASGFKKGHGDVEDTPATHTVFRYPPFKSMNNEFGIPYEFPNWIHFRSLKRRHTVMAEKTKGWDVNLSPKEGETTVFEKTPRWVDDDKTLFDIFLHLPDNLADNLQVSYSEGSADLISTLVQSFFSDKNNRMTGGSALDVQELKNNLRKMLPGASLGEMEAGAMINPKKFQSFGGVPFRTFTYAFTFRPKSAEESANLRSIFGAFKRSMLPGVQGANMAEWTFPNEWAIEFDGLIKNWVDFPLTSVCTGCDIDYTGGQGYVSTKDGASMAISMSLTFTETVPLHRKRYVDEVAASSGFHRKSQSRQRTNISKLKKEDTTVTTTGGDAAGGGPQGGGLPDEDNS